jgi:threonine/homoserine/homoserine lactone efflux protein
MPSGASYALFLAAALTLLAIPGPAVAYIVGQSISGGRRAGFVSVLGISTGSLVHTVAAVVGLSALITRSAVAFDVVRLAGAAYLIVLGLLRIFRREPQVEAEPKRERTLRRTYAHGVVVNVLNPKTALFFLAFLPQFVNVDAGHVWAQLLVLGISFAVLGLLSDGMYAFAAGTAADRLRGRRGLERLQQRVSGCLFICLGAFAAARR